MQRSGRKEPLAMIQARVWMMVAVLLKRSRGISVSSKPNVSQQCSVAAKVANSILGCINRSLASRLRVVIIPLYSAHIRTHLEHCIQFWTPSRRQTLIKLEQVQWRATPRWSEHLHCEEKLKALYLFKPGEE